MLARLIVLVLAVFAAALPAGALELGQAAGRYAIGPGGSNIDFSIDNAAGGALKGGFGSFSGTIRIDGNNIARSRVDITIIPASVSTGKQRIDDFLKSGAVFDVANERQITFRSASVTRTGDNTATIKGRLTARGKTFNETFQATLLGLKGGRISFHVTGRVYRSRYGMDVGTPIYSNIVQFDMTLSGRRG
jgi:polyisoprenoid-binding protein YceI